MAAVNASLARTLQLRFELGLFDPPEEQPYWNISPSEINTEVRADALILDYITCVYLRRTLV